MSQIEGSKCSCGRMVAPRRSYCPDCQRSMAPFKLEAKGVVETGTSVEVTAEGFDPPLHFAVVRIADSLRGKTPARVLVRSGEPLSSGKKVKLEARGEVLWAAAE